MSEPQPLHAGLAARFAGGAWCGVLLRGSSGVGKSDLLLRLMSQGWRMVADDRVLVWRSGDCVWGRAPDVLGGLLEVRGIGVLLSPALQFTQINVVIDCVTDAEEIDRIPEPSTTILCGIAIPLHRLDPLEPSAAAKVAALCGALDV